MAAPSDAPASLKPIHSLILDTGPLIKNDPPANVLRAKAEQLYTLPCIITEIRDPATRSRVETTLLPFVTLRAPRPESIKFIQAFARRTGDLAVLSRPDIEVLALGYELECERNGGDWRLRNTPGQKRLNGRPNGAEAKTDAETDGKGEAEETKPETETETEGTNAEAGETTNDTQTSVPVAEEAVPDQETQDQESLDNGLQQLHLTANEEGEDRLADTETAQVEAHTIAHEAPPAADLADTPLVSGEKADEAVPEDESDDDDEGWITPSNLKKHQAQDSSTRTPAQSVQKTLQAAVLTSDYAMQNVALRMNLNLVAPSLARITHLKSWVLRCHGCFTVCKDTARQFCPSCGQATLLRTSCSTDAAGNFTLHLKRNYQWNTRGNVYSVPKPVHGSSNGRLAPNAAGKNNWAKDLIFAEDQKEYTRAADEQRRTRAKDLMDEDYLPGILSGSRAGSGGKIRVGAGRNVNSRRKR